ncbi:MAG: thermonuclease family protein [Candidatus Omnitrophica bacterium]|nr:thermonuclease family protein [Candidatus Omnitrophota bacterium]
MKNWLVLAGIVCLAAELGYAQTDSPKRGGHPAPHLYAVEARIDPEAYRNVRIIEVLKGDMVRLETDELLHFIGVNSPECQKTSKRYGDSKITGIPEVVLEVMGNEVIQFTRRLVENKYVCIEFDVQQRDQYGILQGYVFLPEEDIFVNAELIRQGYSSGVIAAPNERYQAEFSDLYKEAKQRSQGIWRQWQRE